MMDARQRARADRIMALLTQTNPADDVVVLVNVIAAFIMSCRADGSTADDLCAAADAMFGDVRDGIRLLMATPGGLPQ